jgi:glyoxylase-like metal-dependent hydrolase (beta-lactamase superfamily II)
MKAIFVTLSLVFALHVSAQSKLEITHLTGDFYIYTTYHDFQGEPYPANGLYAITDEGVVMIDSPWDESQAKPLLDSIYARHNKKVVICIATHFHDDRTGSLDVLKQNGVRTYTTNETDRLSKKENNQLSEFLMYSDTTFNTGGLAYETFFPGAGHAPDNIVVWFPESKILYGGCFIKSTDSPTLGNLGDADTKSWEIAAGKVKDRFPDAKYIIPGHESWLDGQGLEHTIELLEKYNKKK